MICIDIQCHKCVDSFSGEFKLHINTMLYHQGIIFLMINNISVLVIHLLIMQEEVKSKSKLYHKANNIPTAKQLTRTWTLSRYSYELLVS